MKRWKQETGFVTVDHLCKLCKLCKLAAKRLRSARPPCRWPCACICFLRPLTVGPGVRRRRAPVTTFFFKAFLMIAQGLDFGFVCAPCRHVHVRATLGWRAVGG